MGFLSQENKQMIYVYSSDSKLGQSGIKIIKTLNKPVRLVNINEETLSSIVWVEVIAILNLNIDQIFDKSHSAIANNDIHKKFIVADWLRLVNQHPSILKNPIAINGAKALRILNKIDIFEFYGAFNSKDGLRELPKTNQINNDYTPRAI